MKGCNSCLRIKSKGYRRTSLSEKAVRHDEIANAPPIQDSYTKPTDKNSKTTRLCHYFNNGRCSYQERCLFLHEEAPFCRYDGLCGREKCMFKHRNSPRSLEEEFHQNQSNFQNQQPWHWIFQPTVRPMYQQRWGFPQTANMANPGPYWPWPWPEKRNVVAPTEN